jgi:hypothetical protein
MITKERLSRFGLILFCTLCAIVIIDHIKWHLDGPRYTHRMWYHDRLDRINEDHKLQIQIDELIDENYKLQVQIDEFKLLVPKLNTQ